MTMASASATKCNIRLADNEQVVFQLEAPEIEGYVIGRSDDSTNYIPDIDFANYDSRAKGVSRRHAALISYRGAPHVIDLFSVNGTYLNGKRLSPDQPYPLGKFNELRLGTLDVIITVS